MTVPNTDSEWFALIEPYIDVTPEEATESDVLDIAQTHAEQVLARVDDLDLDPEADMQWGASDRLKNNHGLCRPGPTPEIRLSLPSLRHNGWRALMQTVRHELVHAWQHKHDLLPRQYGGDNSHEVESFERWLDPLSIRKTGPRTVTEYRYTIRCPHCNNQWGYHRMCKSIRQIVKGTRYCSNCGPESKGDLKVYDDDERLTEENLPPKQTTTNRRQYIFLYNDGPSQRRLVLDQKNQSFDDVLEWDPRVITLKGFTGVGDRAREQLRDEIVKIDDILTDDGELREVVRNAVPSQFHDDLAEEVRETYSTALEHRDEDDLDLFARARGDPRNRWTASRESLPDVFPDPTVYRELTGD